MQNNIALSRGVESYCFTYARQGVASLILAAHETPFPYTGSIALINLRSHSEHYTPST